MKPPISTWKEFLCKLADELTKENVKKIKFLIGDCLPRGIIENLDALALLDELDKRNIISEKDLSSLNNLLTKISRKDLESKIKKFQSENANFATDTAVDAQSNAGLFKKNISQYEYYSPDYKRSRFEEPDKFYSMNTPTSSYPVYPKLPSEIYTNSDVCDVTPNCELIPSYSMNSVPCGICVIFSNYFEKVVTTEDNTRLEQRLGNGVDESLLKETFDWLNFNVIVYKNKSAKEMLFSLSLELQARKISDCFVCGILSHGFRNGVYGNDGSKLSFEELWSTVEKASIGLQGKPKLFFIQACQSDNKNQQADVVSTVDQYPDCLTSLATTPGKIAWRHSTDGSWYIQVLCKILKNCAKNKPLIDMLQELNKEMAVKVESYFEGETEIEAKQMSAIYKCTLRKQLFFKPKVYFNETALSKIHIDES